uniref:Uncharacterized protein n=1 Tax=Ditylenchus dipsaci TaxID=166011 RepID=A0A915E009_9BILA
MGHLSHLVVSPFENAQKMALELTRKAGQSGKEPSSIRISFHLGKRFLISIQEEGVMRDLLCWMNSLLRRSSQKQTAQT